MASLTLPSVDSQWLVDGAVTGGSRAYHHQFHIHIYASREDETYQNIARELNLSETAFPIKIGESEYKIRYFTPTNEVFLCGHATMATAYTLTTKYNEKSPIKFHTKSGEVSVQVQGNQVTLNFPIWPLTKSDKHEITEILGVKEYEELYRGKSVPIIVIVLKSQKQVQHLKPDFREFERYCIANNLNGAGVTAKGNDGYDYVLRAFGGGQGIDEDLGTGIAQNLLAPYWGKVLGKKTMKVGQLSERGSEMTVELMDERVHITGSATPLIEGTLSL